MNTIVTNNKDKTISLNKNFIYNFVNQILLLIIPLITTPYLARVLGVDINGRIAFSSSITSYFILFANLGFNTLGQREIAKYRGDKEKENSIYWSIVTMKGALTLLSVLVMMAMVLGNAFQEKYKFFILLNLISVSNCAFDSNFFFQGIEDFKSNTLKMLFAKIACMIVVFSFVKKQDDAWIYVLAYAVTLIIPSMLLWVKIIKRVGFLKIKNLSFKQYVKPSLLLFLPLVAVTLYSVFDKTMIGLLSSNPDYENGNYEQAYKLNSVILVLITFISPVMGSRNTHDYKIGEVAKMKDHLYKVARYTWMIGIPLIVGVCILGKNLSSWFLGAGYDKVPLLLSIMSLRFISSGFSELCSTQLLLPIGKERYVTIISILGAVINISLNSFLIKDFGSVGAAIATAVTEGMICICYLILVDAKGYLKVERILKMPFKYLISAGVMALVLLAMNRMLSYSIFTFIFMFVIGVSVYFLSLAFLKDKFFLYLLGKTTNMLKRFKLRSKTK